MAAKKPSKPVTRKPVAKKPAAKKPAAKKPAAKQAVATKPATAKPSPAAPKATSAAPSGGALKWSSGVRAGLHRFATEHASNPPDAMTLMTPAAGWELVRSFAQTALVDARGELAPHLPKLKAALASATPPAFDPSLELMRAAVLVGTAPSARDWRHDWAAWAPERALMAVWLQAGVKPVLDVLVSEGTFWLETASVWQDGVDKKMVVLRDEPSSFQPDAPQFSLRETFSELQYGLWLALRRHVDALDDATFSAANQAAHALRKGRKDSFTRAAVAYAFARDPSHALEEVKGSHADTDAALVMLACPTLADAKPLERAVLSPTYSVGEFAGDLLEKFGAEATGLIDRAIAQVEARKTTTQMKKASLRPLVAARKVVG